MSRTADPELRDQWRELIALHDPRRESVAQFCDFHEISVSSFYQWRKRLRRADSLPALLPVEVIGPITGSIAAVIRIGELAQIEIMAGQSQLASSIAVELAKLERDDDLQGCQELPQ